MQVEIELKGSMNVLKIKETDLPEDPVKLIEVLIREGASIEKYYITGMMYLSRKMNQQCVSVLEKAVDAFRETRGKEIKKNMSKILLSLAVLTDDNEVETGLINSVSRLDSKCKLVWFSKALQCYRKAVDKSEYQQAFSHAEIALEIDRNNIAAKVIKAEILRYQEKFNEGLRIYRECFKESHRFRGICRYGISSCLYHLGKTRQALKCFMRCYEKDKNANALYALLVIDWNTGRRNQEDLIKISQKDKNITADILIHLRRVPEKLISIPDEFSFNLQKEGDSLLVISAYLEQAREKHKTGFLEEAKEYYLLAETIKADDQTQTDQIYLGLCLLSIKSRPYETNKYLNMISKKGKNSMLYSTLICLIDIILNGIDSNTYETAVSLHKKQSEDSLVHQILFYIFSVYLDVEKAIQVSEGLEKSLWTNNNRGVMLVLENKPDAVRSLKEATNSEKNEYAAIAKYNLCLYYIYRNQILKAEKVIKRMEDNYSSDKHTVFLEALILKTKRKYDEAIELLTQNQSIDKNPKKDIILGIIYNIKKEFKQSKKYFVSSLQKSPTSYGWICLGSMNIEEAKEEKDRKRKTELLKAARENFIAASELNPNNIYALTGLCLVLWMIGDSRDARDVLLNIRESTKITADAFILLGNCLVDLKNYQMALNVYKKGLDKFGNHNKQDFNIGITRVLYIMSRVDGDISIAEEAIRMAELCSSYNIISTINLALCIQGYLGLISDSSKNILDLNKALDMLSRSEEYLTSVLDTSEVSKQSIDKGLLMTIRERIKYSDQIRKKLKLNFNHC
eukprot:GHVP01037570.1.p1 GENE.GHVP01037570.1~~GHVP01037570.1.p1  ORF type:complete len:795 (+),score=145.09 GHVP01037570.1:423-2807(+)